MAEIRLTGVNKVYPGGTHAVHDVDLHIADGEFMIMVGPSGCAKSTILRMIAGLETPTTGAIEIGGRVVNDVAPKDRDIAMVFQSYALYPHMTVRENMAFGLKLRRMPQGEIDQRVAEAARILGLEQLLDRLPKAMSGGQRQRVAMGRAIVREPQAFLMDEPLSNLDAKLRVQMRTEIAKLHQRLATTTVYVTHDQVEAMTLGQRICILRKGVVQQVDTPFQVYQNPANVFVGGFIGSPGMNFMDGHLLLHDGMLHLQLGDRVVPLPASVSSRLLASTDVHGRGVIVGIRPEHLAMTTDADPLGLPVQVELTEAMGAEVYAYFTAGVSSPDLTALSDTQATSSTFVARLAPGAEARSGERIALRADLDEIHLFDPASLTTLLAPVDEAQVRARQAGAAIEIAGGTAQRPVSPVAAPVATTLLHPTHVAGSTAPVQPVIHLHQTIVGPEHAAAVGTLEPQADHTAIASVFDQPVAAPIALEPLVLASTADGTGGGFASAGQGSHPRPSFATQVAGGSSLDTSYARPGGNAGTPPAPVVGDDELPAMHHQDPSGDAPEPVAAVEPAPVAEPAPAAEAPVRPRGFAPRVIGEPAAIDTPAPTTDAAAPRLEAEPAELDAAIDAIESTPTTPTTPTTPATSTSPFAGLVSAPPAQPGAPGTGFREALARVRADSARAGDAPAAVRPSILPPPVTLRPPAEPPESTET